MRDLYHAQLSLTAKSTHPRAEELVMMSRALDANLDISKRVRQNLLRLRKADAKRGREGMSAEQVLRAALIKQMFSFSYSELSFHLGDSSQLRGFCRLPPSANHAGDSGTWPRPAAPTATTTPAGAFPDEN